MSTTCLIAEALSAAIDELAGLDPSVLGDGETVLELHRQLERLAAVTTRATAGFDASGGWEADGARSASAWLTAFAPLPASTARVRLGRQLRHLPAAEEAWLGGEVGEAQVGVLARAHTPATAEALARDEHSLVAEARRLRFADFARVVAYWRSSADPEGAEEAAQAQHEGRGLHLSESFEGSWFLDGALDPVGGTIVARQLKRIEDELFEADWAEARERAGEEVAGHHLARTPAQRRADALVEMATRSGRGAHRPGQRPGGV